MDKKGFSVKLDLSDATKEFLAQRTPHERNAALDEFYQAVDRLQLPLPMVAVGLMASFADEYASRIKRLQSQSSPLTEKDEAELKFLRHAYISASRLARYSGG